MIFMLGDMGSGDFIKEICFQLNFEDPAYFARFFKKKTELSPQAYRDAVNK